MRYRFVNWKTGEPNFQDANESCVRTFPDGQWEDSHCDLQSPFICFDAPLNSTDKKRFFWIDLPLNWIDAETHCRVNHTDLAVIENSEENEDVASLGFPTASWIGLFRYPWIWSDGYNIDFENWRSSQPDNAHGEEACVNANVDHKWSDADCSLKYPFLCYGAPKVRKTFVRMKFVSDVDPSNPAVHIQILQQLDTLLTNQEITDFKLNWKGQENPKKEMKQPSPC
ncbi:C-type lectin BML-2-like [Salarias fasciatus]|uniref:C-type lectin BML-2-like n=1 Tax=Salarias fasciatus TaxID=181472 RepID=UPI0011770CD3|nr:C-type lectin BML-2-like [Salarias fasciatus]